MIVVCITTFNEAASISALVWALARSYFVIVVDDGSTDGTADRAEEAGAFVLETTGGWGIGPSLMEGWRFALDVFDIDGIVQIDAGGSHSPREIERFIAAAKTGADMVVGSRFRRGSRYYYHPGFRGKSRPFLSRIAGCLCNFAQSGSTVRDWTSGYRYFSRPLLSYLLTKGYNSRMHGWQIEVLAYAQARGFRVREVPITYVAGRSSFNAKVAFEAFKVWLKVWYEIGWVNSRLDD